MKINRTWKIEECVTKDETRWNLQACHLEIDKGDPGKGQLVATDGHILALAPVTVEKGDKPGPVSPEALARARKLARRGCPAELSAGPAHTMADGSILPRPDFPEGTSFPDWRNFIPREINTPASPGRFTVAVDVNLLIAASKAIGTPFLRLTFKVEEKGETFAPIKVEPNGDREGQFALVMPIRINP